VVQAIPDDLPMRTRDLMERQRDARRRVGDLLLTLGRQGLQRLSKSSEEEIRAVATTAHNARLVRVSRGLEALATVASRYLDRDPLFRTGGWVSRINQLWLLHREVGRRLDAGSLPEELEDLVGVPRRTFTPVDGLVEVHCLGASAWVTDSDYVGVSLYLYAPASGRMLQAAAARPTMYFGTDPGRLWTQPISDSLALTVQELAHGAWALDHVRISHDGRVSLHAELGATPAPEVGSQAYAAVSVPDALAAVDRVAAAELDPLAQEGPVLVCIEPGSWGRLEIDDKHARAVLALRDLRGAPIEVHVPLREENNLWVDNLSTLTGTVLRPDALFGRVSVVGGALRLEPWTALYHEPVTLQVRRQRLQVHQVHLSVESLDRVSR
jgi:hypothetical protein